MASPVTQASNRNSEPEITLIDGVMTVPGIPSAINLHELLADITCASLHTGGPKIDEAFLAEHLGLLMVGNAYKTGATPGSIVPRGLFLLLKLQACQGSGGIHRASVFGVDDVRQLAPIPAGSSHAICDAVSRFNQRTTDLVQSTRLAQFTV